MKVAHQYKFIRLDIILTIDNTTDINRNSFVYSKYVTNFWESWFSSAFT